jgi:hypothetical protein
MDSDITVFTQSAGTTLVTLMAGDAWQRIRDGLTRLWRRVQPHRAEILAAELEASREDVLAACATGDQQTLDELRQQWQGQLRRLLAVRPDAAAELRGLLDELGPEGAAPEVPVTQHATASGHARVYQAGRDQHITES